MFTASAATIISVAHEALLAEALLVLKDFVKVFDMLRDEYGNGEVRLTTRFLGPAERGLGGSQRP